MTDALLRRAAVAKRWLIFLAGLAIGTVFFFLALRGVVWSSIETNLTHAHSGWLLLSVVPLGMAYALRIERWRSMLAVFRTRAPYARLLAPYLGSFALNNILPFRLGDAARALAFRAELGAPPSAIASTLIVERVLDLWALCLLLCLSLVFMGIPDPRGSFSPYLWLIGSIVALLSLTLTFPRRIAKLAILLLNLGLNRVVPRLVSRFVVRALLGVSALRSNGLLWLSLLSILAWLCEGSMMWSVLHALPIEPRSLSMSWAATAMGTLATLIPGTPGHFGTFDFFASAGLIVGGVDRSDATLCAVLTHLIMWLAVTLSGLGAIAFLSYSKLKGAPCSARRPGTQHSGL